MRMMISAVVVVAMLLAFALPAVAQQGQAYCDWYWYYKFKPAGGWEYWCWDPQLGWWYATNPAGTIKSVSIGGG
jgi:hypothetical protein